LLLVRIARPRGHFLGRVRIRDQAAGVTRDVFVPLKPEDGVLNPQLQVESPPPGVVIYRFEEAFLYPNSSLVNSHIVEYVRTHTRRGRSLDHVALGDRPWNDPGPKRGATDDASTDAAKPRVSAIVLDFSGVSNIDTTGVQALVDTRNEVERWADAPVPFHFATILSPWIRRALVAGGFGGASADGARPSEIAPVVRGADAHGDALATPRTPFALGDGDVEAPRELGATESYDTLVPHDTPFFHFDLPAAVAAAEATRKRAESDAGSVESYAKKDQR
jgi:sodium-independent sulfate anion transporter 11